MDYFKKTQDPTLTTHGKVRADTARSAGGNKIEYQTEDNRKWRVRYEKKDADYKYDTPEEVK